MRPMRSALALEERWQRTACRCCNCHRATASLAEPPADGPVLAVNPNRDDHRALACLALPATG